jgi:L-alanine-DL-glutamate epimerase-like enolase superfamily enzyme
MKIESVDVYVCKFNQHYKIRGVQETPGLIEQTDYYFEPYWCQIYSRKMETCLIKITADNGLSGWGEAQAPILPEIAGSIVRLLLGPFLLGRDPLQHEKLYSQMFQMMEVRGHGNSFFHDAIAAIDIALWDLKGKYYGAPVFELLGGAYFLELPAYVSGLRQATLEEQAAKAKEFVSQGFQGVKLILGQGLDRDIHIVETIRSAMGPDAELYVDLLWKYSLPEMIQLEHRLVEQKVGFLEAPMPPNDLASHRMFSQRTRVPVAVGEQFRTVHEIAPWIESGAAHYIQPDVARCGITALLRIAELARAHHMKVAPHLGISSCVGMAATLQVSASLPHFLIQEFQLDMYEEQKKMLEEPLRIEHGKLVVPQSPGLGIEVKESYIQQHAQNHWRIGSDKAAKG